MLDASVLAAHVDVDLVEQHIFDDQDAAIDARIAVDQAHMEPVGTVDEAEGRLAMGQGLEGIAVDQGEDIPRRRLRRGLDEVAHSGRQRCNGRGRGQHDRLFGRHRSDGKQVAEYSGGKQQRQPQTH